MSRQKPKQPPYSRERAVELYFIEHRGKVLDIAAFLDRVERAPSVSGATGEDFRLAALREAIGVLIDGKPDRARRVLELLSDQSAEPIAAAGTKGALGAFPGKLQDARTGSGDVGGTSGARETGGRA